MSLERHKCKCCIRLIPQNNRSQEVAFRLKEKSKLRTEMENHNKHDYLPDYLHNGCRFSSGDSQKVASGHESPSITCNKADGCRCHECQRRAKIADELIAEEESNKKKKNKKKKKKSKKHDAMNDNDDNDEEFERQQSEMQALKDMEEEEFSYNPPVIFNDGNGHYKIANPIEANNMDQWIPVKTKAAKQECPKSNKSLPATPGATNNDKNENSNSGELKKKNSIDGLGKDLTNHCSLSDSSKMTSNSNNSNTCNNNNNAQACCLTNAQKARLISIDADLADKRDELDCAIELITEAIQLDHKNPILYINRSYYYERLTNYQKALDDAEKAIDLEEKLSADDYREYALFRRYKAHEGLENFEAAETDLNDFLKSLEGKAKAGGSAAYKAILPRIHKNLLILRLKKLVHRGYSLPLARLYASKFGTIREALEKMKTNCRTLKHKSDALDLHLQIFNLQCSKQSDKNNNACCYNEEGEVLSDEEIYLSDDEEFDMLYSKDRFSNAKDILVKNNPNQYYTDDYHEQLNSKGQKALWLGNVAPNCDATLASGMFSKFGNVTFCRNFTNENPVDHSSDVGYLLLHYDNDISPKLVMAYFREEVIPGLSKDGSYPLLIRFRNKNEKMEEDERNEQAAAALSATGSSSSSTVVNIATPKEYQNIKNFANANNKQQANSECYYWRTTGCDRERCAFKHIPANKGIDRQHWMRRKH